MLHSTPARPPNRTSVRSQRAARLTKAALHAAYVLSEDFGTSVAERLFTSPHRYPRPAREREVLAHGWPFSVDVTLRSPGRRGVRSVAAWRWGHGPAVLLVHGWEGRGTQLGALVDPLVHAGLSVVAFDALGHGDSPGHRLYMTDMADCVVDVARAAGPLHAIIAHSAGAGAVVFAYQRGGVDASRNVMIAPNAVLGDAVAQFGKAVALDDRDCAALEHQLASKSGVDRDALALERLVGSRDAALLVIHDRDDREVAFSRGEQLAAAWPGAALVPTAGLGHRRILRDGDVIAQAVELVSRGIPAAVSPLIREVDRMLAGAP